MRRILYSLGAILFVVVALIMTAPIPAALAGTTTVTITGWLVPDAAHFSNTFLIFIYPLAGMVILSMFPLMFKRKGDIMVYFALGGLFLGTLISDLSVSGSSTNAVPFAIIFVAGLLIFLWWWNSP